MHRLQFSRNEYLTQGVDMLNQYADFTTEIMHKNKTFWIAAGRGGNYFITKCYN